MIYNSENSVPSEVLALKEIAKSGPRNEHLVHAFDYWFEINSDQLISRTFIKLELCDETLEDYLKAQSTMEPLDLVEIMMQILSGVCHCHERKVCHRDLKEANSISLDVTGL
jgi:serine/threonine protein kinase